MYFNQKAINNVQSHYQSNIMELTLLPHLMIGFNFKIKRDSFSEDGNCS